ncbi:MAG: BtpA/SgcQ family protein [Halolamina sp.]|uniref:BtpA/SgcQ family protein n=1 Tax=Halolamina sp. TaxID=1940283 RepID=UPI002FC28F8D
MNLEATFGRSQPLVGMVHLDPLPGAPQFDGDREAIIENAREDARALEDGGVDAVMVENFGDAPFYPDDVPKHVVASMTQAAGAVVDEVALPVGINILRNDAMADLAVAQAVGAEFMRVNIHTGARVADQGVIEGQAYQTMRERDRLGVDVNVFADHDVKHSAPIAAEDFTAESFADNVERGLADATVVSGMGTGHAVDGKELQQAADRREEFGLDVPLFVGSGVTADTVGEILQIADGVIVGTALKAGDASGDPVSEVRTRELVEAADAVRQD